MNLRLCTCTFFNKLHTSFIYGSARIHIQGNDRRFFIFLMAWLEILAAVRSVDIAKITLSFIYTLFLFHYSVFYFNICFWWLNLLTWLNCLITGKVLLWKIRIKNLPHLDIERFTRAKNSRHPWYPSVQMARWNSKGKVKVRQGKIYIGKVGFSNQKVKSLTCNLPASYQRLYEWIVSPYPP